jgi:hypothetical protein
VWKAEATTRSDGKIRGQSNPVGEKAETTRRRAGFFFSPLGGRVVKIFTVAVREDGKSERRRGRMRYIYFGADGGVFAK